MNKEIVAENKKKLEDKRTDLLKRLGSDSHKEESSLDNSTWVEHGQKSDENAAEVSEYADALSVQKSLRERMDEIDQALDAIQKGTYGICRNCGNAIEDARLEVMPTATLCMNCKDKS